jgi:hypothetical protein
MEINMNKLDSNIVSKFLAQHPDLKNVAFSDRILIFRRGIGTLRTERRRRGSRRELDAEEKVEKEKKTKLFFFLLFPCFSK